MRLAGLPRLPAPVAAAVARHAWTVVVAASCGLAGAGADLGLSLAVRHLVDRVLAAPGGARAGLAVVAGAVLGLAALRAAARWGRRLAAESAGHRVAHDLRVGLFAHLLALPAGFFHEREVGRLLVRFVSDLNAIRRYVARGLADLAADGVAVSALLAGMLAFDWRLGAGVAILGALEAAAVARLNAGMRAASRRARDTRARLAGLVQDDLSGIEAVKAFRREPTEARRVRRRSRRLLREVLAQARLAARAQGAAEVVHGVSMAYVVGLGGWLVLSGGLTAGTLVGFLLLFHHVFPSARRLVLANEAVQSARVQADRVAALLAREVEPPAGARAPRPGGGGALVVAEALDGRLDLRARPGEIVAVVGPTASGKSALAAYLLGFRRPASGRLLVDGRDVAATPPGDLRRRVAWAAADAPLFRGSLRRNVRLGRRRAGERSIARAVRDAGLARVAARLPGGLGARVGSGGRRLSAGERLLTSLARALLVGRPLLVLDEPFRGLDPDAVETLWGALERRRRRTTTLILTTDAAAAARADRVVPMGGGGGPVRAALARPLARSLT